MRNLTTTLTRILVLSAFLFSVNITIASDIELRFTTAHYDEKAQELFVDVQVQYTQSGQLILAGQNYRFYYDSEVLSLDTKKAKSKLPAKSYGQMTFESHRQGIKADDINQLIFDDNLGFANFSIDLSDNLNGGITLTEQDGWVTIVTLKFDVLKSDERYDIVWGREGVSDLYATAFVEMGQWMSPTNLKRLNITYFGDLTSEEKSAKLATAVDIQVGPNPAIDFINISFLEEVKNETTIIMRNAVGQQVKNATINPGARSTTIDVSDLIGSGYFLEISDAEKNITETIQVIVAK